MYVTVLRYDKSVFTIFWEGSTEKVINFVCGKELVMNRWLDWEVFLCVSVCVLRG